MSRSRRTISTVSFRRCGEYCRDERWVWRWTRGRDRYETTDDDGPVPTEPSITVCGADVPRFTHQYISSSSSTNPATDPSTMPTTAPGDGPLGVRPYPSGTVLTPVASRGRSLRDAKLCNFRTRVADVVTDVVEGCDRGESSERRTSCAKPRGSLVGGMGGFGLGT